MRKLVFFIFTIFLINGAYAQRKAGGWAVQGDFGIMAGKGQMNKLFGAFPDGQATSASAGASVLIGNKGYLFETNLFMNDYFVDKDNFNLPYRLYGLNALGGWSYEGIRKIYLNFKAGGFIGIQKINNGNDKEATTGATYPNSVSGFAYGILISPELEFLIYRNITLKASYSQYWQPSGKWSKFQYGFEFGVKYYL